MADSKNDMVPINMRDPFFKDPFFSNTWDDFDKMRNEMMSRSKQFWSKVDEDFANFDETVRQSHSDMDRQMAPFQPQLPRWAIPDDLRPKWTPMTNPEGNEVIFLRPTDSTKINRPGHNIRMYWTNFRQPTAHVQKNVFGKTSIEVRSPHL